MGYILTYNLDISTIKMQRVEGWILQRWTYQMEYIMQWKIEEEQ